MWNNLVSELLETLRCFNVLILQQIISGLEDLDSETSESMQQNQTHGFFSSTYTSFLPKNKKSQRKTGIYPQCNGSADGSVADSGVLQG